MLFASLWRARSTRANSSRFAARAFALLPLTVALVGGLLVLSSGRAEAAPYTASAYTTNVAAPSNAVAGQRVELLTTVTSQNAGGAVVDVEVYDASGARVHQSFFEQEQFAAGQTREYRVGWTPRSAGTYSVRVGIFAPSWAQLRHWSHDAATFTVNAAGWSGGTTTNTNTNTPSTPAPTPTPAPATNGGWTPSASGGTSGGANTGTPLPYVPSRPAAQPAARPAVSSAGGLAPLPAGWTNSFQLGMDSQPGTAGAVKAAADFGFRYQYLAGGANTGRGWATWNSNGTFVSRYIQESIDARVTPVFSYYQIYQSAPGNSRGEAEGIRMNLENTETMRAYFGDLKLFFERAGTFGGTQVVLHVEPDMWGFAQQQGGDDATRVHVKVAATGMPELGGLPDNMAGVAQGIRTLRDRYAPNVVLAYQLSVWGTGNDIALSNPSDAEVDRLAARAANYYNSLNSGFDIVFSEFSDRDAAFKQYQYGDNGQSWWDAEDFRRNARFLGGFSRATQKRIVMWQIPLGNTKVGLNNQWNAYQDNRVEWLLDDPSGQHLAEYINAGVVALLFGRGADGATCACDANKDGRDDDGGYFKDRARAYYAGGAIPLP